MKNLNTLFFVILFLSYSTSLFAQKEGRIGIFTGVAKTGLINADDVSNGDLLPTFKGAIGVEGGYFITIGRRVPFGLTGFASYAGGGQNYLGKYSDSSFYEAYTRLRYMKGGAAFQFGTNMRRQVSLNAHIGASFSSLTGYSDRYEHFQTNGDRYVLAIKNKSIYLDNDSILTGGLDNEMYNKVDYNLYGGLGVDILFTHNLVFSVFTRFESGMLSVENLDKKKITLDTKPVSTIMDLPIENIKVKYHTPVETQPVRAETMNSSMGIFISFKYRFVNTKDNEIWYRQPVRN